MNSRNLLIAAAFTAGVFLNSCSNTRHLPAGESLFLGGSVNITTDSNSKQEIKAAKAELENAIRPRPNRKFLGMRIKLTLYNLGRETEKERGLNHWLRNKAGEPPALTSSFDEEYNLLLFNSILQNRGFFLPDAEVETITKKKKTRTVFSVKPGPQYHIRNVTFLADSTSASGEIASLEDRSMLRPGDPYNLEVIKSERDRIDKILKERGYYFFRPDYILFEADSNVGTHQVDFFLKLKLGEVPPEGLDVFRIRDVYVYPNFRLGGRNADTSKSNITIYDNRYKVIGRRQTYKPVVFRQAMQFHPGDIYNRTDHNISLNRLLNLGTFKFVKNEFEVADSAQNLLDVHYYLTPLPKKSLRFEIGALTQTDSRAGSHASIGWRNRNAMRGAELFQVKLRGGFEAQYGGLIRQPNTYHAGVEASLAIPRFVVPFVDIPPSSIFMPRTYLRAAYMLETRNRLFRIHSVKAAYGFAWKEDIRKDHQLFPIEVTYVRTDTLDNPEGANLNYSNLVFNGLIIGPVYQYTYNSQMGRNRRSNFFFDGKADFSGGFNGIGRRATYGETPDKLFGLDMAQYIKLQTDFRYYQGLPSGTAWANRLFLGFGMPYGRSSQMPNVKQFFSGGNSSLRGFRSRMLGPGTFNEFYATGQRTYIELLGDLKLEMNSELRVNLYRFLKGAVFADAGNIWLYNDHPDFPGGKFTTSFYKELAVNAGAGLRLDFTIVMLRLDLGVPVRKPWLPEGERWVFNEIRPGDPVWRKENMILNIAIGYPF